MDNYDEVEKMLSDFEVEKTLRGLSVGGCATLPNDWRVTAVEIRAGAYMGDYAGHSYNPPCMRCCFRKAQVEAHVKGNNCPYIYSCVSIKRADKKSVIFAKL